MTNQVQTGLFLNQTQMASSRHYTASDCSMPSQLKNHGKTPNLLHHIAFCSETQRHLRQPSRKSSMWEDFHLGSDSSSPLISHVALDAYSLKAQFSHLKMVILLSDLKDHCYTNYTNTPKYCV